MNGSKNVNLNPSDTGAAGTVKALNGSGWSYTLGGTEVCSQTYCHSDGNDDASPGVYGWNDSPGWTAGTITTCNVCHGNSPTTNNHQLHVVGIHYKDIYTGSTGLATAGSTATSSHGSSATSTVLNCNTCHNNTVTSSANSENSVCTACHSDTDTPATGNDNAAISGNVHVDGTPDIAFQSVSVLSKAQVRDDITTVTELNDNWTRDAVGYKASGAKDTGKNALNTGTMYNSGTRTCSTINCHNGNTAVWDATGKSCGYCHKDLTN
jgi:predicted CxxxxCH...CXXCH cytochrome family protein